MSSPKILEFTLAETGRWGVPADAANLSLNPALYQLVENNHGSVLHQPPDLRE